VSTQHEFTESTATGLKLQNVGIAYCCFWSGTPEMNMEQTIVALPEFYINPRNSSEKPQKKFAKNLLKKLYLGPISLSRKSPRNIIFKSPTNCQKY
jgi:hypothetical protein